MFCNVGSSAWFIGGWIRTIKVTAKVLVLHRTQTDQGGRCAKEDFKTAEKVLKV